jgi:hypothetical protein
MATRYGFEVRTDGQWSADAAGEQGESNYYDTRGEAEAEVHDLARILDCSILDIRVMEVEV